MIISGERKKDIITEDFKGNGYILGLKVHGSYMGDGIHHYSWYNRTYKICACTIYTHVSIHVYCVCTIYTCTAYMFTHICKYTHMYIVRVQYTHALIICLHLVDKYIWM